MKKLIPVALCALLAGLCACGQAEGEAEAIATTVMTAQVTTMTEAPTTSQVSTTAEPPTITQILTTKSNTIQVPNNSPAAYKPILDALYRLNQSVQPGKEDICSESADFLNFAGYNYITDNMGYAVIDINNDGIPELILLNNTSHMLALYTLRDNEPVWLTGWTHRGSGAITADGIIYSQSANSGSSSIFTSYKLEPGSVRLIELSRHTTGWSEGGIEGPVMQETILGPWRPSTEEEHQALWDQIDNPPNPLPLTFIPIEQ